MQQQILPFKEYLVVDKILLLVERSVLSFPTVCATVDKTLLLVQQSILPLAYCNSRQYATARATVDPTVCAIPGTRQDTAARATADKKACVQHQSLEGLNSCDNSSRCRHRHQEARRTHQHDAGADRLISDQTCPGHRCEKYAAQVGKLFRCSRPKNETKAVGKQNKRGGTNDKPSVWTCTYTRQKNKFKSLDTT